MKISIVIPLYNKVQHIRRAVNSVLAQTWRDFEIIVVDDGSTDGGGDRIREFDDLRIRLIRQENAGVSAARNRGVFEASTEMVAFLDADDEWLPCFLETVMGLRKSFSECGMYATAHCVCHNGTTNQPAFRDCPSSIAGGILKSYFKAALGPSPVCSSSVMIPKKCLQLIGGFPVAIRKGEDLVTWAKMALRYRVAWSPVSGVICHMEAASRTDGYIYSGNFPFFEAARAYLRECGGGGSLPKEAEHYFALWETATLRSNWLAGNRAAMREILKDCRDIRGFRSVCLWWKAVSLIPHQFVLAVWRARAVVARCLGRRGRMQPVRTIYRPITCNHGDKCSAE